MKKDLDKLFSRSIETYYFLLLIVVIIKLLGGNYFSIVYTNRTLNIINDFITYWRLENVWYAITLYINVYITLAITCNDNSKRMKKYCTIVLIIAVVLQILKTTINLPILFVAIDMTYLFILALVYLKLYSKINKTNIRNYWIYMLFLNIVQLISIFIRNVPINNTHGIIVSIILNLDYLIVLVILYKLYFKKGAIDLWDLVVSYGSQKLTSLKDFLANLHVKSLDKKVLTKEDKITRAIYIPLYALWNLFTMLIIILIAFLNDAFIEAIFITIAFWCNKKSFGKPFHFQSVATCFAFSSFVYYVLTRITFKIDVSFFISIFLGVALSYITSHFIEKSYKLYKGMSEELLYSTIKQVTDDPITIEICKQFYCDRYNDNRIANTIHYSIDSVRKKRQKVNKDLRNLLL